MSLRAGFLLLAGCVLIGTQAWAQGKLAPYAGPDKILSFDTANMTVTVSLVGGEAGAPSGANFDGFSKGAMVIRVPLGWTVHLALEVPSSPVNHSALIVPWSDRGAASFTPAFPGSDPVDFRTGMGKGDGQKEFTFTADRAGQYAVVCGVPGHAKAGMWDEFDVVAGLASPEVLVQG
jgi:hypothetical protein